MPSDANHRYDPVPPIPTYDEAVSAGSGRTAFDGRDTPEMEARSLLRDSRQRSGSTGTDPDDARSSVRSRSPNNGSGYRQPTVETDDEDSLWDDGSLDGAAADDAEAAHVRREMQELDMDDDDGASGRSRSSIFGKRLGFSLSLPQWRQWKWRWRLPRLRIQLPSANGAAGSSAADEAQEPTGDGTTEQAQEAGGARSRWRLAKMSSSTLCLLLARLFGLLLVLGFLYLIFVSDLFASLTRRLYDLEAVRQYLHSHVDPQRMRAHVAHFTSYAHLAGSEGDYALAVDVKNMFEQFGLQDVSVEEYYTYINYPKAGGRALEVLGPDGSPQWSAKIEEDEVGGESAGRQTYVFHALSKAGDVKGPLIYANYGTREDFQRLHDMGIDTKGAIALVRYYGPQGDPGLKVKAAELAGFVGCIIYSDPADDGYGRPGGEPAPQGRLRPSDAAHRASVALPGWVMGDPLTPGWESTKENPVLDDPGRSRGLVKIPSIPLAWRDAHPLLARLAGHGKQVPPEWVGFVPEEAGARFTGDQSSPVVRLRNEQDEVAKKEIWNVYGRIYGYEQKAKSIIVGNRRDALAFGAASPHSGTAIMMEMARLFGALRLQGWQPMRTIEFMSWDGGAFNMAGSTEYVEKNLESMRRDGLAYINLDEAVGAGGQGGATTLCAAGNPVFRRLLLQALQRVPDPSSGNGTLLGELWDLRGSEIEGLGAASDYVAFQDAAGTSSLELRFGGGDGDDAPPPPPRGSSYENLAWIEAHADPGFVYHKALGQIVALMLVDLADRPILPFDMDAYSAAIARWVDDLAAWLGGRADAQASALDLGPLRDAVAYLGVATKTFARWEITWQNSVLAGSDFEPVVLGRQRAEYNARMGTFDSDLLDLEEDGGVPNRAQYKHVVFGPKLWASREPGYFPAVRDAVEAGDWALAAKMLDRAVGIIRNAAAHLVE